MVKRLDMRLATSVTFVEFLRCKHTVVVKFFLLTGQRRSFLIATFQSGKWCRKNVRGLPQCQQFISTNFCEENDPPLASNEVLLPVPAVVS